MDTPLELPPPLQHYLMSLFEKVRDVSQEPADRPEMQALCRLGLVELNEHAEPDHPRFPWFKLSAEGELVGRSMITFNDLRDYFKHMRVLPEVEARRILSFFPNHSAAWYADEIHLVTDIELRLNILGTRHGILVHAAQGGMTIFQKTYYGTWDEIEVLALEAGLRRCELRYRPDFYEETVRAIGIPRENLDHVQWGVLLDLNDLQPGLRLHIDKSTALSIFQYPLGEGFKAGGCIVVPVRTNWQLQTYVFEALKNQTVCPVCAGAKQLECGTHEVWRNDWNDFDYEPVYKPCERCAGHGWIKPDISPSC